MTKELFTILAFSFLSGSIFFSCKKELSCEGCINGNKPPVAHAGRDTIIVLPQDSIPLDGSSSYDTDGSIKGYLWSKISGPSASTIVNSQAAQTDIKNLSPGIHQVELTVTDNHGLSAKDTVLITVHAATTINHPPIADAGPDQTITLPANSVILDGTGSTDPDNNISGYAWIKISGPSSFNITSASAVLAQVTNLAEGVYQFELKVMDAENLFAKDTIQITVNRASSSLTELIFNDLEWYYWHDPNDPYHAFDEIYLWLSDTSNIIPDVSTSNFNVWVKRDPASNWELASNTFLNGNYSAPFWYSLAPSWLLIELCYPWDLALVGKKASVKIRF